jgi:riboflavin-specific deaminase-like protein
VKRPFVFINMAMTADGKIASVDHKVTSFSSCADHAHLLELRDKADAIITGAGTLNAQPKTTLGPGPKSRKNPPLRVIASGRGQVDLQHKLFRTKGAPTIILTTERIGRKRLKALKAAADTVEICGENEIDFLRALGLLRAEWGVKRILSEGGGHLNDSLFRAGVVDELNLTVCPLILGGTDAPTISDGIGFDRLSDAAQFKLKSQKLVNDEMFLVYRAVRNSK